MTFKSNSATYEFYSYTLKLVLHLYSTQTMRNPKSGLFLIQIFSLIQFTSKMPESEKCPRLHWQLYGIKEERKQHI